MDAVGSAIRVDTRGREVHARPAAQQRRRQRGVDLRQDALCLRRPAHAASRPAVRARSRQAAPGELGRGAGARRRQAHRGGARAHRRHRRRPRRRRGDVRAQGSLRPPRREEPRLPPGRRQARSRRWVAPAICSTPPSPASSRPTPSCSSAPIRASRRRCSTRASASAGARAASRSASSASRRNSPMPMSTWAPGRRRWASWPRASTRSRRRCKSAQRPLVIVGSGVAARADGAALLGLAARIALGAVDGKDAAGWNPFNVLHTAASRVAGLDLGFVPGEGGLDVAGQLAAPARASSTCCTCSAPTRSRCRPPANPSSSTRAITATAAPIAPTSSCPAPPTPRRASPTSTPRAARR